MCPIVSLAAKETMREGTEIKFHLQNDHKKKMWLERKMELKQNRNDKKNRILQNFHKQDIHICPKPSTQGTKGDIL